MSIDVKMAWRNIWRNPRRTILTVSAITFASAILVFMLSWQLGSYETMINASVKIHTGHLQIQAEGYQDKRSIRLVVSDPAAVGAILEDDPLVAAYTYRAQAFSLISSEERTQGALVVGIDPEREAEVSTLDDVIREGTYLAGNDGQGALLGFLLADSLKVKLGDELAVLGQGRDGSVAATIVNVRGIYRSGLDEFDRSSLQITLDNFQEVYFMRGAVHEVVAIADSLGAVSAVKAHVSEGIRDLDLKPPLVALDWTELTPGLLQAIKLDLISGMIFYLILIMVVAFSILNTFLMAIFERTKEFGVLMALGTSPARLTKILLIESGSMTLFGIAAGILVGSLVTLYFSAHGIEFTGASEIMRQWGISGTMYPRLSLISAVTGPALVFLITFLAALYPALKIRRLRPVEAMAHV
ncbi:MAG: ABC transporter permease [Candidatus Abyssubacteria bacterium]